MKTGIATVPLDYGRCPGWLFQRMKRLSRGIILAITEEFGEEELLRRFSDPVWFQSLGCVIGFDWNSSGLTTITLGAVKSVLFDLQDELGFYVCGGKGKTSKKTPNEIEMYGLTRGFSFAPDLIYASKMAAKVDSCLIQNSQANFQLYHHNFIFTKGGQWVVIQQAMAPMIQKARRYHWFSSNVKDYVEEPHSGIVSDVRLKPLNLVAKESRKNKEISAELVKEEPKTFLKDISKISETSDKLKRSPNFVRKGKDNELMVQRRIPGFAEMELNDVEFYWHPVVNEKFDLKRLKKTIEKAHFLKPENFEQLLATEGVGPRTIRALSLVTEIIYGAKPSYEDPARYSFGHGGKDGTPYFPRPEEMDLTIKILERGIQKSKVSEREKIEARKRLNVLSKH